MFIVRSLKASRTDVPCRLGVEGVAYPHVFAANQHSEAATDLHYGTNIISLSSGAAVRDKRYDHF